MSSANIADEIKALKEKIAALERENSSLKEWKHKQQRVATDCFVQMIPAGPAASFEARFIEDEGLLKNFFLETLDGIVFWGKCGQIIAVNEATCKIFGLAQEEMLKLKISDLIYQNDEKYSEMKQLINEKGALRDEAFFLLPNGETKLLEFTVKLNTGDGYHMTIVRDASERYHMEQKLRRSEERFRRIFEGSIEGMILWDKNCKHYEINPSGMAKLELTPEDLDKKNFRKLFIDLGLSEEFIDAKVQALPRKGRLDGRITIPYEEGRKKHFEYSVKHQLVENLNLIVFRNITEKIDMEAQLHKSDTLNMLGELAAGIAHEIRNPMTALKGFIQLLENSTGDAYTLYFQVIKTELQRIDSIINEFLILAKPQSIKYETTDISKIMNETVALLTAQAVLHDVEIKTLYDDDLPKLLCEPNQLKKVFINIIKNAIEVMPKGGLISVTVSQAPGNRIHICIQDEGEGIPTEKIKKLGEPFYTTKERGTGLGLMVSFKIIEEHGGTIEIESKVGDGTLFHIYLPLTREMSD
ncbi:ATP-binding protein [Mesobacillus subterraneus]|uniref:PAS domain-containing sensor histidine kinase n=1 Tax=Mesobacillus subterraneus TaxID=285983 RepID=UPI001CFEC9BE|nr:ATP-binding protein [Mesobacillus subterraneus]WLR53714.1 ATP-binding protein [Mesobacillus subterraneus]